MCGGLTPKMTLLGHVEGILLRKIHVWKVIHLFLAISEQPVLLNVVAIVEMFSL